MTNKNLPALEPDAIAVTRDALHAYSQVLGGWLESCRPRRKHWWHISLRPTVRGLSTDIVHAGIDFELELNLRDGLLQGQVAGGGTMRERLTGRPAVELAAATRRFLLAEGVTANLAPPQTQANPPKPNASGYSDQVAVDIARVWTSIAGAMSRLRAEIPEETSPIQVWPHHFDLSMIWLPGEKIPGLDPADEEHSDKQMNFGFTLGDEGIPEPYFYVTAYPQSEALASLPLPPGARWRTTGFTGAVLLYRDLRLQDAPEDYLLELWRRLLAAGREHLLTRA